VPVSAEGLAVGVHTERAELLESAGTQRRAPRPAIEPEDKRLRSGLVGGLDEVVEERAAMLLAHRDVARVLVEVDARGLAGQRRDLVGLLGAGRRARALGGKVLEAGFRVSPCVRLIGRPTCERVGPRFDEGPQHISLPQGRGTGQRRAQ
jgi:hypothetical protein